MDSTLLPRAADRFTERARREYVLPHAACRRPFFALTPQPSKHITPRDDKIRAPVVRAHGAGGG